MPCWCRFEMLPCHLSLQYLHRPQVLLYNLLKLSLILCLCGSEVLLYHPRLLRAAFHPTTGEHTPAVQLLALCWWQQPLFL